MGESTARKMSSGARGAFEGLYRTHGAEILAYFRRRLPAAEVQDAAADVFEIAWRRFGEVPDGDEAIRWLFGVARNVLSNRTRTSRRAGRLDAKLGSLASANLHAANLPSIPSLLFPSAPICPMSCQIVG